MRLTSLIYYSVRIVTFIITYDWKTGCDRDTNICLNNPYPQRLPANVLT